MVFNVNRGKNVPAITAADFLPDEPDPELTEEQIAEQAENFFKGLEGAHKALIKAKTGAQKN